MAGASGSSASPAKKSSATPATEKKKVVKKDDKPQGADIRAFFGGPPASSGASSKTVGRASGSGGQPIEIDDSDDEPAPVKPKPAAKTSTSKPAPSKAAPPKADKSLVISSTSPSPPPKPSSSKPAKATPVTSKSQTKPSASAAASSSKSSSAKRRIDSDSDEIDVKPAKRVSTGKAPPKKSAAKPNYLDSDSDEEDVKPKKATPAGKSATKGKTAYEPMEVDSEDDGEDDFIEDDEPVKKPAKPKPKAAPKKTPVKTESVKKPAAKKTKKEDGDDDGAGDGGDDKPKPKAKPKKEKIILPGEAIWRKAAADKAGEPKQIPEGTTTCLQGLKFVFTGELECLGRDEAIELVKRCSGVVNGAPSGMTSAVVIGENAGESKLKKIKDNDNNMLNEGEFFEFIRYLSRGDVKKPQVTETQIKAQQKEEKKILEQAQEMEAREKEEERARKRKERALKDTGIAAKKVIASSSQLWTTRYAPQNVKEICGNKSQVERILTWLQACNFKTGFKRPGKDGMGINRALLISGPPGIGKTTSAHLMAKMAGYSPIELNASDARSKKLVENSTNIDNTSLDGFFAGKGIGSTMVADIKIGSKTCLIMDEVDGMSAGDRGGVGALNVLIKKTRIPLILICNDKSLQKMKPLQATTFSMVFKRPQPNEVRSRIMSILFKEKMKIPANVVDELIKGANSDIRQVLNMLSTFKLSKADMDFDEGKALVQANQKNTIMTPFTIIDRLTGPYSFSRTNRETLNDKSDLYFHDISFVPLFMQEHYLKTNPSALNNSEGPYKALRSLELTSKAADCISDGDLIDRMIHGSEQHWSLLPLHAIQSTVAPAYHIYGTGRHTGGNGWGGPSFPQWLGQNSKQGKLGRQLVDIQIRMRLRVSGGRQEIREQYMPLLASKIVTPLKEIGSDAIEDTIKCMDEYYLGKDDWEAFVELGIGEMNGEMIMKAIPSATKAAFTRQYNKAEHPIAFHKGDMFANSKKKIADQGPAPDNDEVFEEEAVPEDDVEEKGDAESDGENDVTKDKLIKAVKAKGKKAAAGASVTAAAKKGKKK